MDNAPACPCYDPVGRYLTGQARAFCPQTGGQKMKRFSLISLSAITVVGLSFALTQCTGTAKVAQRATRRNLDTGLGRRCIPGRKERRFPGDPLLRALSILMARAMSC